jgi:hypothetical protein
MSWYRYCIFQSLQLAKKEWIRSSDVPSLHKIRSFCSGLKFGDFKPSHFFLLWSRKFFNFIVFILRLVLVVFLLFIFNLFFFLHLIWLVVFFCLFLMFFEDSFKVIIVFSSKNVLIFFYYIYNFYIWIILFAFGLDHMLSYSLFFLQKLFLILFSSLLLLFFLIF